LLPKVTDLQELWSEFFSIISDINKEASNANDISAKTKAWVTKFTTVYQAKDVTPYIHAFSMYVGECIQLYSNIAAFNQQGLEKLNDATTKQYQRSTNHHLKSIKSNIELFHLPCDVGRIPL